MSRKPPTLLPLAPARADCRCGGRADAPETNNKWWCWCFWSLQLPVLLLMQCKELRCRAWDESNNCQPANLTWNLMCAQPPLLLPVQSGLSREGESPSASVYLLPQLESSGCLGAEAAACAGRGMGNNPEFRVEIHPTTLTTGFGLRFIHPTIAGPIKNEVPPTPTKQPQPPFTRRHLSFVIVSITVSSSIRR